MGGRAKHITVLAVFKNAGSSAVVKNQKFFHFFSNRRHGKTIARANISDHRIDLVTIVKSAHLLHLLGRSAVFVHINRLDPHSAEAHLVIGRGRLALVEGINQHLCAIDRRHAKAFRRLAG